MNFLTQEIKLPRWVVYAFAIGATANFVRIAIDLSK